MKWASVPSEYRNVILRDSVRTGRNFSPARKVRSITAPSWERLSFVRTNAPPLPGFTCWKSTILKTLPSTSMCVPFLNWLVEIMCDRKARACARTPSRAWPRAADADLCGRRERQPHGRDDARDDARGAGARGDVPRGVRVRRGRRGRRRDDQGQPGGLRPLADRPADAARRAHEPADRAEGR